MKELTLVIPAKNESECLPRVLNEIKNYNCKKIIVVPKTDLNTQNAAKNFELKQNFYVYLMQMVQWIPNILKICLTSYQTIVILYLTADMKMKEAVMMILF